MPATAPIPTYRHALKIADPADLDLIAEWLEDCGLVGDLAVQLVLGLELLHRTACPGNSISAVVAPSSAGLGDVAHPWV